MRNAQRPLSRILFAYLGNIGGQERARSAISIHGGPLTFQTTKVYEIPQKLGLRRGRRRDGTARTFRAFIGNVKRTSWRDRSALSRDDVYRAARLLFSFTVGRSRFTVHSRAGQFSRPGTLRLALLNFAQISRESCEGCWYSSKDDYADISAWRG